MRLYIVRHAWAEEPSDFRYPNDAERPLTDDGRRRFRREAIKLVERGVRPGQIASSPYLRTMQTAELLAKALEDKSPVTKQESLAPGAYRPLSEAEVATLRRMVDPKNAEAWKLAGFSESALKQYDKASEDLQKALDLQRAAKQEDPNTLDLLAQAYIAVEKFDQALPLLVIATTRPGAQPDAQMLYYRGFAEFTGEHTGAVRSDGTILPNSSSTTLWLGPSVLAILKNVAIEAGVQGPLYRDVSESVYGRERVRFAINLSYLKYSSHTSSH